jgi:phosphoserine aminotransferase
VTGAWGVKAVKKPKMRQCERHFFSADTGFKSIPAQEELRFSPNADMFITLRTKRLKASNSNTNSTAARFRRLRRFVKRFIDTVRHRKYALIYAGAQKNIGPSGVTLVIIRTICSHACRKSTFSARLPRHRC